MFGISKYLFFYVDETNPNSWAIYSLNNFGRKILSGKLKIIITTKVLKKKKTEYISNKSDSTKTTEKSTMKQH